MKEAIRNQARDVQVNGSQTTLIEAVINADSITDAIGRGSSDVNDCEC